MANTIKKVLDIVSTVVVAIIGVLAIAYIVLMLCGFKLYTVLSPSMEPTYKTGSVIFVKPVDTAELKVGDPITYKLAGTKSISTHRIHSIETIGDKIAFRTKGDANDDVDAVAVDPDAVIGKPVFSVPNLGKILSKITSTDSGKFIAIGVGIGLVLLVMLPGLIFDKDEKTKKGKETAAEASGEAALQPMIEENTPDVMENAANPPEEGNTEE